jgi:predicted ATPase
VRASRSFFYEAELHRLRAALFLHGEPHDREREAEAGFRRALEMAGKQGAQSLALRAATSLAQLWHHQGRRREARDLLAAHYAAFTEGHATADLAQARGLLERWGD